MTSAEDSSRNPLTISPETESHCHRENEINSDKIDLQIPETYARTNTGRLATDLVMNHILDSLLDGRMQPGQRINATRLAEALDVSIVPVREALHFLAGEGVVKLLALKGARISTMESNEIVDWWNIFRAIAEISFEPCALAIVRDPSQAQKIGKALNNIAVSEVEATPARFIMALTDFHRVVHEIADKPVLDDAFRRLQVIFWCSFLPAYIPFEKYGPLFVDHYRMVGEALMRGDYAASVANFEYHVNWSSAIIEGARPAPGSPWSSSVES